MRSLALGMIAAGSALLVYASGAWGAGALARERARAAWEAIEARRTASAARASVDQPPLPPGEGDPVARLRIPRLGLDEVVVEGVGDASLRSGPGHLPGTPLPGGRGNSIVSAHRDRHFRALVDLRIGDTITTETAERTDHWVVRERRIVAADAPALFGAATPRLTLTTCWPIRWFGPAPDRLLVTATPM